MKVFIPAYFITSGHSVQKSEAEAEKTFLKENSFINGETITVDGGMTKLMVYHNDCGWKYRPEE